MEDLGSFDNLMMLGRTGTFWYNNMDHSIRQALDCAEAVISGSDPAVWRRHIMDSRAL